MVRVALGMPELNVVPEPSPIQRSARSPVIRALRGAGEEVQFGLALEAVCQQGDVARALCEAVIARSARGGGNAQARRAIKPVPPNVTCLGEQRLEARVSRRMAKTRSAGRVDLRFTGDNGWKLGIELKIDSGFQYKQLERYLKWGQTIAIVRKHESIPNRDRLRETENWVGAATWESLVADLRELPIDPAWLPDWHALLDVMEDDGDFAPTKPDRPETLAQVALLEALKPELQARLQGALAATYEDHVGEIAPLKFGRVRRGQTWSSFGVTGPDGTWLWIEIRNLSTRAPRLRIDYYTFPDWRARRQLKEAHQQIQRAGFQSIYGGYRFEKPIEKLAGATADNYAVALDVIVSQLDKLVRSRVFDVEVARLRRKYRG
jgi:hypothetical protein